MACLELPDVPIPALPFPLSLTPPAIPDIPGLPDFCCKLPIPPIPPIPIKIPPLLINVAFTTALETYIEVAKAYIDSLAFNCPLE